MSNAKSQQFRHDRHLFKRAKMNHLFYILSAPFILIHFFYLLAVTQKNLSVIDTAWGLGFILISLTGAWLSHFENWTETIVAVMVFIWGLRLSLFIHFRNHGKGEDFRYAKWRQEWGEKTNLIAYFKVYCLQFVLMVLVALPILATHYDSSQAFSTINRVGLFIWLTGLIWETVADYQKSAFKKLSGNQHKLCQKGLWAFSRHPNYFGEALLWWGIGLTAFQTDFWWGLIGPAFLTFLLRYVSGVPMLEVRHKNNPEYQIYASQTPIMIPSTKKIVKEIMKKCLGENK